MRRTASLVLSLLPKPIKEGFRLARNLGARAVVLKAEWGGGFERPGIIPVDELTGRTLHDFRRALNESGLTLAAIDISDVIREGAAAGGGGGASGLDRIYALSVRSIEVLSDLASGPQRTQAAPGMLSLEQAMAPAGRGGGSSAPGGGGGGGGGMAGASAQGSTALRELTTLGLNRGVRVGLRTTGGGWATGERKTGWLDGLGLDLDLPELRRFGQTVTGVLDAFRGQILHLRCDDYELNLQPQRGGGLLLPQSVQKAEPETLDELTIFLEHAGYEGAWTLKNVPPAQAGADPLETLKTAMETLNKSPDGRG